MSRWSTEESGICCCDAPAPKPSGASFQLGANVYLFIYLRLKKLTSGCLNSCLSEMKFFPEYKRWKSHYLLFLEFAIWSSSNSPRLHVRKVAAPRRPHGAAPWVPPLSTALPRSSPTWLGVWARLEHFACFYPQAECAAGSRTSKPLALALCRANKSWHPVDHYWQSCMRWDEAQRREVHSFFIYFILRHATGVGVGGFLLVYWTSPLLSPALKLWQSALLSF